MKSIRIITIFLFTLILPFSTIFATINKLQQFGLSSGDLPDVESDTILINPAYGITATESGIFVNFFHRETGVSINCDIDYNCDEAVVNQAFIDLHYIQPVNNIFGFFLETTGLMKNFRYAPDLDNNYGAIDGGGGIWLKIIPGLTLGLSGKYYSGQLFALPGSLTESERASDTYSARAGFSIDFLSKWNLGYSIQYNPGELSSIAATMDYTGHHTYLYPFSSYHNTDFTHNITLRGDFSNKVWLANNIRLNIDDYMQSLNASSIASFMAGRNFIFTGVHYNYYKSDTDYFYFPHYIQLLAGAEFPVYKWMKFRISLDLFSTYFLLYEQALIFDTFNYLAGGFDFLLDPRTNFEYNFSAGIGTFYGISMNFEINFRFK